MIAVLLIPALLIPDAALAKKPLTPEKAKEKITQRGVGHSVRLVLADKSVLRGMIAKIGTEDVEIGVEGSGQIQAVPYSEISEYHNGKMSKGGKIGWGVAGGVIGAITLWSLYILGHDD